MRCRLRERKLGELPYGLVKQQRRSAGLGQQWSGAVAASRGERQSSAAREQMRGRKGEMEGVRAFIARGDFTGDGRSTRSTGPQRAHADGSSSGGRWRTGCCGVLPGRKERAEGTREGMGRWRGQFVNGGYTGDDSSEDGLGGVDGDAMGERGE